MMQEEVAVVEEVEDPNKSKFDYGVDLTLEDDETDEDEDSNMYVAKWNTKPTPVVSFFCMIFFGNFEN